MHGSGLNRKKGESWQLKRCTRPPFLTYGLFRGLIISIVEFKWTLWDFIPNTWPFGNQHELNLRTQQHRHGLSHLEPQPILLGHSIAETLTPSHDPQPCLHGPCVLL